jgi:hypothetical protein
MNSSVRYTPELAIDGTYSVSTHHDGTRLDGWAARQIARDYASSGTVGRVLAQLGTSGKADLSDLLTDLEATRREFVVLAPAHAADLDNLSRWATDVATEVR